MGGANVCGIKVVWLNEIYIYAKLVTVVEKGCATEFPEHAHFLGGAIEPPLFMN